MADHSSDIPARSPAPGSRIKIDPIGRGQVIGRIGLASSWPSLSSVIAFDRAGA